jgi:hypothetical protein
MYHTLSNEPEKSLPALGGVFREVWQDLYRMQWLLHVTWKKSKDDTLAEQVGPSLRLEH